MRTRICLLILIVIALTLTACGGEQPKPTHLVCTKDNVVTVDVNTINGAEEIVLLPGTSPLWTWEDASGAQSKPASEIGSCVQTEIK